MFSLECAQYQQLSTFFMVINSVAGLGSGQYPLVFLMTCCIQFYIDPAGKNQYTLTLTESDDTFPVSVR